MRILFLLLVLSATVSCSSDPLLFYETEAYEIMQTEKPSKAIEELYFLREAFPANKQIQIESAFHLGRLYHLQDQPEKAMHFYREVIGKFNKWDKGFSYLGFGNYYDEVVLKNEASIAMAVVLLEEDNYQASLKYLKMAEQDFSYFSCGNAAIQKREILDKVYLANYLKLEDLPTVISLLNTRLFSLEKDSKELQDIIRLIKKYYSSSDISYALETMVKKVRISEEHGYDWSYEYAVFSTVIFNQETELKSALHYINEYEKKLIPAVNRNTLPTSVEKKNLCREFIEKSDLYLELAK